MAQSQDASNRKIKRVLAGMAGAIALLFIGANGYRIVEDLVLKNRVAVAYGVCRDQCHKSLAPGPCLDTCPELIRADTDLYRFEHDGQDPNMAGRRKHDS